MPEPVEMPAPDSTAIRVTSRIQTGTCFGMGKTVRVPDPPELRNLPRATAPTAPGMVDRRGPGWLVSVPGHGTPALRVRGEPFSGQRLLSGASGKLEGVAAVCPDSLDVARSALRGKCDGWCIVDGPVRRSPTRGALLARFGWRRCANRGTPVAPVRLPLPSSPPATRPDENHALRAADLHGTEVSA
ncbi:hypothetical protein Raf01_71740 [Rugosimonospora africana]|uniref:Uncharacterized protein n=1 Tax=Rugosimonospora africana TaxID=556532 RepID=A0A8J3VU14_9ACTN|nr:hypothetical protein Raf01_71740 [Rugosimonospora africana]